MRFSTTYKLRYSLRAMLGLVLIAPATMMFTVNAHAKNLGGFISDLYGGNGLNILPVVKSECAPNCEPEHFSVGQTEINQLNSSLGGSVPATSFSALLVGTTIDIVQGLPVRNVESLGPLYAERAETLGQGILDFGLSFGQAKFARFEGMRLDQLSVPALCTCAPADQASDKVSVDLHLSLQREEVGFYATYGLSPRWDVGIVVPVVRVHAKATADATFTDLDNDGEQFVAASGTIIPANGGGLQASSTQTGGTATGIGDIVLRSKYNFVRDAAALPDFSVVGQISLPTGDKANLLGSGSTDVLGMAVISKQFGWFAPHINLGYEAASGGVDRNDFRYAAGADASIIPEVTVALDVVGREYAGGQNLSDFAVGLKWGFSPEALVSAGIIMPINRDTGLRANFAWTAGMEVYF